MSENKQRYIDSSSADTVYACSGGKLLPGKHLSLGLAIKSLTGSKQLFTLTNRFGHTADSETIRRFDMELEHTCKRSSDLVPNGIVKRRDLSIGLAWDNFDLNIETLSGAGTVHHTYGTCYQNIDDCMEVIEEITPGTSSEGKRKRKSTYNEELPPYFKKPKYSGFDFIVTTYFEDPQTLIRGRESDNLWVISFAVLCSHEIPMRTGWNSKNLLIVIQNRECAIWIIYNSHLQL